MKNRMEHRKTYSMLGATLIDSNAAVVQEKAGALAEVYEFYDPSELSDGAPRLRVAVCHASLERQCRYETFTIRYVTPFALDILQIYRWRI